MLLLLLLLLTVLRYNMFLTNAEARLTFAKMRAYTPFFLLLHDTNNIIKNVMHTVQIAPVLNIACLTHLTILLTYT